LAEGAPAGQGRKRYLTRSPFTASPRAHRRSRSASPLRSPKRMGQTMHAEIAGAGFSGLASAIALRQRGWSVRVPEKEATLRGFGAGMFVWEKGLRVLHAIGASHDVVRGAHQAPAYESRRDGVCVAFEKVNGPNRFCLLTMTRQHLYSGILAAARRQGVESCTRSEAVAARAEGALELQDRRCLSAGLVIAADIVRCS